MYSQVVKQMLVSSDSTVLQLQKQPLVADESGRSRLTLSGPQRSERPVQVRVRVERLVRHQFAPLVEP